MNDMQNVPMTEIAEQLPVSASLASELVKAEIDQQISTAKQFPRSIDKAMKNILTLATLTEEAAAECCYAVPRDGKTIQGPSIRLAEIIAGQWGNCRMGARVTFVDKTEQFIEAEGVFHDLETNSKWAKLQRRGIRTKAGKTYSADMIITTGNAACSIAVRNAVLAGVPKGVWMNALTAAQSVVKGDIKTLSARRENVVSKLLEAGATSEQVFAAIGVSGMADITINHMPVLAGMYSALRNNEETIDSMFGKPTADKPTTTANPLLPPKEEPKPLPETGVAAPPAEVRPFLEVFTEKLAACKTEIETENLLTVLDEEILGQDPATQETVRVQANSHDQALRAARVAK